MTKQELISKMKSLRKSTSLYMMSNAMDKAIQLAEQLDEPSEIECKNKPCVCTMELYFRECNIEKRDDDLLKRVQLVCSACKVCVGIVGRFEPLHNFCPNCGAMIRRNDEIKKNL